MLYASPCVVRLVSRDAVSTSSGDTEPRSRGLFAPRQISAVSLDRQTPPKNCKRCSRFLQQATERSGIASAANSFKANLRADEGAPYDEIIEIDLDKLRPHVNGPFTPDLAHPVGVEFSNAVKVSDKHLVRAVDAGVGRERSKLPRMVR